MRKCFSFFLVLAYTSLLLYSLFFHGYFLQLKGPVLSQEGAFLVNTHILLQGKNPYTLEALPEYAELYGPLYSVVSAPISAYVGTTFLVHRLISAFFLLGCCLLIFLIARACRVSILLSTFAGSFYYILFTGSYSIASRPDTLGTFLLLASLYVPLRGKYSSTSLGVSILFGILAFLTKAYFIFGIGCVALYLFLFVSRKQSILYFGSFLLTLVFIILWIQFFSPYYLFSTTGIHQAFQTLSFMDGLIFQLKEFSRLHAGIGLIVVWFCFKKIPFIKYKSPEKSTGVVPQLVNFEVRFVWVFFCSALFVLLSFMGWHIGAHLIYFYQFLSPPSIILSVIIIEKLEEKNLGFPLICLGLNFLILALYKPPLPEDDLEIYDYYEKLFASGRKILAPPLFAHLQVKNNLPVFDNGQSCYLVQGALQGKLKLPEALETKILSYWGDLENKIDQAYFDIILIDRNIVENFTLPRSLIKQKEQKFRENYIKVDFKKVPCYYSQFNQRQQYGKIPYIIDLWIRKKN